MIHLQEIAKEDIQKDNYEGKTTQKVKELRNEKQ